MSIYKIINKVNVTVDQWFMSPEPNAAGRLGLFRIVFSLFYIWHLTAQFPANLSGLPLSNWESKLHILKYVFNDLGEPLSPVFFNTVESFLVASLILLLFGYKTQTATILVLLLGCLIEAFYTAASIEHSTIILTFYIPFFMAINDSWSDTYSLDALLKHRRTHELVSPSESHWSYFISARAFLVILSFLFLSSAIFKVSFGGTWLIYPKLMSNLVLHLNIKAAILGLPLNYFAPFISQAPIVYHTLRLATVILEGLFFLSLVNLNLRSLFVSLALIFHSINALWLTVTFTPVLVGYGLFVDWQAMKEKIYANKLCFWTDVPLNFLIFGVLFFAALIGIFWNSNIGLRSLFSIGGLIDVRTIWYPVLPFSLCWFVVSVNKLLKKQWN